MNTRFTLYHRIGDGLAMRQDQFASRREALAKAELDKEAGESCYVLEETWRLIWSSTAREL